MDSYPQLRATVYATGLTVFFSFFLAICAPLSHFDNSAMPACDLSRCLIISNDDLIKSLKSNVSEAVNRK